MLDLVVVFCYHLQLRLVQNMFMFSKSMRRAKFTLKTNAMSDEVYAQVSLVPDNQVMLTDFDLAKLFDENMRSNSLCGTMEYMAPEIVLEKGHDKVVDCWSMGELLYKMLMGKMQEIYGASDYFMEAENAK